MAIFDLKFELQWDLLQIIRNVLEILMPSVNNVDIYSIL